MTTMRGAAVLRNDRSTPAANILAEILTSPKLEMDAGIRPLQAAETSLEHPELLLEGAVRDGTGHRNWVQNDPDLVSLHGDPRFWALVER
jgi:hypothetical protein